ncbi:MAG: glycerate kinase, partial [Mycobacterium sp.]|nr:glycerate kinase [Mycobacterium sp.]
MRVLIAPDSYGESLTAVEAAAAIAAGWNRARPGDHVTIAPQSDGGPGFVAVLAARLGGLHRLRVCGPLDAAVDAQWVFDPASATAYLECAQACGLHLLGGPPTPRTALSAHSRGVGQLMLAALRAGARRIVLGLGGSASTDGGRGLVDELGGLDAARRRLAGVELIAACDVEHPLLGAWGAARVFGPQKGADPATVAALERRLGEWARELDAAAGRPVSAESGAGAAGGIGAALLALGGRRESGAAVIAEHTDLAHDMAAANLVVTGEGKLDDQSL